MDNRQWTIALSLCAWMVASLGCGADAIVTAPTVPDAPAGRATSVAVSITISIVGNSGTQAFSPNPGRIQTGNTFVFSNGSSRTHRIVADNGEWDAGTINAGSSSDPMTINSTEAGPYHCTIHSSMTGTLN